MTYTVHQLAQLAGVSVRTLHYYDEIGLLNPSFVSDNGYRHYEESQLVTLQQILFFRELDFSLEKIAVIMQSADYNPVEALIDQQKLLEIKRHRLDNILTTIKQTITSLKGGKPMSDTDKYSAFTDPTYLEHKTEVEQRWGQTDAYKQSQQRVAIMSKADLDRIKAEQEEIAQLTAELMTQGFSHDSAEIQAQVERFYQHLRHFYDPSYELFKGLGQMYVDDPRFTKVYEDRATGFAVFMRDAMAFYAEEKLKK